MTMEKLFEEEGIEISKETVRSWRLLSPLVGDRSGILLKKDSRQAGMTYTEITCRYDNSLCCW